MNANVFFEQSVLAVKLIKTYTQNTPLSFDGAPYTKIVHDYFIFITIRGAICIGGMCTV